MSYHRVRPEDDKVNPNRPGSTVMHSGRVAAPHAENVLGGIQNSVVEDVGRTPEEEKAKVHEYHQNRENTKKANAKLFDDKTGESKEAGVKCEPDPVGDSAANVIAPPEEVKKNAEAEKKAEKK